MQILVLAISVAAAISLLISIVNFFTIRIVRNNDQKIEGSVSVLIPMRDEEFNAKQVINAVLAATGLQLPEFLILNDGSTDRTQEIINEYSSQIKILTGAVLPDGWLGKPFACHQLAHEARGEYLVFLDADVRLKPNAISAAISLMDRLGWDFISPYPAQLGSSRAMQLIQPMLQWSWLASVPLRFTERAAVPSMIIANGQFFIVKRIAYESISGHAAVKAEVLEDLSLARALGAAGFKGGVAEASAVATCTMYENNAQLISGYTKSLWKAFGGVAGTFFTVLLLFATQILPTILILNGVRLALLPFALMALTHLLAAIRVKADPINTALHPFAGLLLIALICESYRRKSRGQLEWRGRRVR